MLLIKNAGIKGSELPAKVKHFPLLFYFYPHAARQRIAAALEIWRPIHNNTPFLLYLFAGEDSACVLLILL